MTSYRDIKVRCAACGRRTQVKKLASMFASGPADLDGRPPPLSRQAVLLVESCDRCGYAAHEIADGKPDYPNQRINNALKVASERFGDLLVNTRAAVIAEESEAGDDPKGHWLRSIWAAEDTWNEPLAQYSMEMYLQHALANFPGTQLETLRVVDILRRASRFDEVIARAETVLRGQLSGALERALKFEIERANAQDVYVYQADFSPRPTPPRPQPTGPPEKASPSRGWLGRFGIRKQNRSW